MSRAVPGPGNPPSAEAVLEVAACLDFALTPEEAGRTAAYLEMLARWNRSINLVGPDDWREVLRDLIPDSWFLARFLDGFPAPECTLDLGAGGGLPGIPLRIVRQAGEYVMVEPRQKRAAFLRNATASLGLTRIQVFPGRVEELPARFLPAQIVLSRAFRPWPEVLACAAPLLSLSGLTVVMSNDAPPQASAVPSGWTLERAQEYPVRDGRGWLWAFRRVA